MTTPLVSQLMTELNQFLTQDSVGDQEKRWAMQQTKLLRIWDGVVPVELSRYRHQRNFHRRRFLAV